MRIIYTILYTLFLKTTLWGICCYSHYMNVEIEVYNHSVTEQSQKLNLVLLNSKAWDLRACPTMFMFMFYLLFQKRWTTQRTCFKENISFSFQQYIKPSMNIEALMNDHFNILSGGWWWDFHLNEANFLEVNLEPMVSFEEMTAAILTLYIQQTLAPHPHPIHTGKIWLVAPIWVSTHAWLFLLVNN